MSTAAVVHSPADAEAPAIIYEVGAPTRMGSAAATVAAEPSVSIDEIIATMQRKDENQILAAAQGAFSEEWIYEFKVQGKTVKGISVTGAQELARIRAEQGFPIRMLLQELDHKVINGVEGIRCVMLARDARSHAEFYATSFYPYRKKDKDGNWYEDNFPDRKALAVAQRNAVLGIVPAELAARLLEDKARLVAENKARRELEAADGLAARRAQAPKVETTHVPADRPVPAAVAAGAALPDPYGAANAEPACPLCGGEMWDNRANKSNPRAPDFKCKNGPRRRGEPGCEGVIWPPKE